MVTVTICIENNNNDGANNVDGLMIKTGEDDSTLKMKRLCNNDGANRNGGSIIFVDETTAWG